MSAEDDMTIDERRKYLRQMKKRYGQAKRKERGRLLDEMQAITHLDRKSLIRLMKGSLERKPRRQQRGKSYGPEVDDALRVIAESLDHVCAERLTPNLVWMAGATWRHAGPGARIMPELALHLQLEGLSRLGSNRAGGRAASRSRFIGEGFTGNQKAHG